MRSNIFFTSVVSFFALNREVTNFKPRVDETFELGKSLDALIQSAETVVTNRRRSTQVASGNVSRTERRVVEIQQTFQVSEGKGWYLRILKKKSGKE